MFCVRRGSCCGRRRRRGRGTKVCRRGRRGRGTPARRAGRGSGSPPRFQASPTAPAHAVRPWSPCSIAEGEASGKDFGCASCWVYRVGKNIQFSSLCRLTVQSRFLLSSRNGSKKRGVENTSRSSPSAAAGGSLTYGTGDTSPDGTQLAALLGATNSRASARLNGARRSLKARIAGHRRPATSPIARAVERRRRSGTPEFRIDFFFFFLRTETTPP